MSTRKEFEAWWTGSYGPFSIRAEWAASPDDAAWMAWQAQQERIDALERRLKEAEILNAPLYSTRKDAERYRAMRNLSPDALGELIRQNKFDFVPFVAQHIGGEQGGFVALTGEDADAAIDAAMQGKDKP
jgi:hypothetical protein